jgi:hypothetical protein
VQPAPYEEGTEQHSISLHANIQQAQFHQVLGNVVLKSFVEFTIESVLFSCSHNRFQKAKSQSQTANKLSPR